MPTVFAANDTTTLPFDRIALTVSSDIDFTDPDGPTGGVCPRGLYAAGAGNLVLTFVGTPGGLGSGTAPVSPTARTVPVAAAGTVYGFFTALTASGTTATGVSALI